MNAPLIVEVTKGATTSQVRVYIGHGVIVTCNDRQVVKSRLTSFMSALGYKLTSEHVQSMSAAPKAEIAERAELLPGYWARRDYAACCANRSISRCTSCR